MTQPIASVVKVAATPEQAKVFAALLQAEGIPASIEGDSLADEVAVSRRMLNLNGTRVLVPTASLERAREILGDAQVDEDELTAQALAASDPEQAPPARQAARVTAQGRWPLVVATGAAVVFFVLWMSGGGDSAHPLFRYETTETGLRQFRIADGKLEAEYFDRDHDGTFEEIVTFCSTDQQIACFDENGDGRPEQIDERRKQGVVCAWSDTDNDGLMDQCVVKDAIGKELQRLRWVDGTGFEAAPR
jgi:hypothetical protein